MKKNGYVDVGMISFVAFTLLFISFIAFLVVSKYEKESKMSIQDVIQLKVFEPDDKWVVVGLLNDGHVAVLMPHSPYFSPPPNTAYQYHGVLAINNIDADVDDIVKLTEYSSPHKNGWYEITSLIE